MDRSAVIYAVNDRLIIAGAPKTTTGMRLQIDPVVLPSEASQDLIASQLVAALQKSELTLPHPQRSEWKGSFDPFLKAAGVRSFRIFMTSARLIAVDQNDWRVLITPYRNLGAKEGFLQLETEAEIFPNDMYLVAGSVVGYLT